MSAKKKTIDIKQFESLCGLQCTQAEICAFFNIDHKTLDRIIQEHYNKSFSQVFAEKREFGKISLRRNQFKLSETNPALAIWLGKQMLKQSDPDKKVSINNGVNIPDSIDDLSDDQINELYEKLRNGQKD